MDKLRQAAEQALEALESLDCGDTYKTHNAASALRKALAEPDHMIKTWRERCEEHPDHAGIVSDGMIWARMQKEIDELRQALDKDADEWYEKALWGEQHVDNVYMSEKHVHKTDKSIHEPVAWIGKGACQQLQEGTSVTTTLTSHQAFLDDVLLYIAPPKKEWVGLSDEEIYEHEWWDEETAFAVNKELKEKNGG